MLQVLGEIVRYLCLVIIQLFALTGLILTDGIIAQRRLDFGIVEFQYQLRAAGTAEKPLRHQQVHRQHRAVNIRTVDHQAICFVITDVKNLDVFIVEASVLTVITQLVIQIDTVFVIHRIIFFGDSGMRGTCQ